MGFTYIDKDATTQYKRQMSFTLSNEYPSEPILSYIMHIHSTKKLRKSQKKRGIKEHQNKQFFMFYLFV